MTDEEYGRAWAQKQGFVLKKVRGLLLYDFNRRLPKCLLGVMDVSTFQSEKRAYKTLGRAVRKIHATVPRLPEGD